MVELIEEIIPRISKKLYNKEINGVKFLFDEKKDEIIEDHKEKEFIDKYSKIGFKGSKINKKITRKVSKDSINQVNIETQLNLISEKPENDEDFYDIGLDEYSIKINSDLKMVENKDDKELIKKIELIREKLDYEERQKFFEKFVEKEMGNLKNILQKVENSNENDETDKKKLRNLLDKSYSLTSISVLTKSVSFTLSLSFGSSSASFSFKANCGGSTSVLASGSFSGNDSKNGGQGVQLSIIPFTVGGLQIKYYLVVGSSYSLGTHYEPSQYTYLLSGSIGATLGGNLLIENNIITGNLQISGNLLSLSVDKTYNSYTNTLSGTITVSIGPVQIIAKGSNPTPWQREICTVSSSTRNL